MRTNAVIKIISKQRTENGDHQGEMSVLGRITYEEDKSIIEYIINQLNPMLLIEGSSLGFISFRLVIAFITKGLTKAIITVAAALSPGVPLNRSTEKPLKKPIISSCHCGMLKGSRKMNKT